MLGKTPSPTIAKPQVSPAAMRHAVDAVHHTCQPSLDSHACRQSMTGKSPDSAMLLGQVRRSAVDRSTVIRAGRTFC